MNRKAPPAPPAMHTGEHGQNRIHFVDAENKPTQGIVLDAEQQLDYTTDSERQSRSRGAPLFTPAEAEPCVWAICRTLLRVLIMGAGSVVVIGSVAYVAYEALIWAIQNG